MRKLVIHSAGGYDKLSIEEHKDLEVKAGEVAIDVHYSGINFADIIIRWGLYASAKEYVGWPITPGFEVSGVVSTVGEGVSKFKAGDKVVAVTRFDGHASQLVVPEHQVFALPKNMTMEEGAAFPSVYMTAYHALFQNFILRKGSTVLVHSAAGGVGSALVQVLKIWDCKVVGVVGREHKKEIVEKLGADEVIVKSKEDLWKRAEEISSDGYDVVLDANGVETLKESFGHLRPTGKLVIYGFHTMFPKKGGKINWLKLIWSFFRTPKFKPMQLTQNNVSVISFNLSFLFDRLELLEEAMNQLIKWIEEGKLQPPQTTTYKADKVAQAHADLESGNTTGKLVLDWT
jgi:NADPH:quinone reductase-like Zn-dependent oxidoreductase